LLIKLIFLNWNRDFFSIGQALSPHENIHLVKFHEEKEDEKMGYYILCGIVLLALLLDKRK